MRAATLKARLDALYRQYDFEERKAHDPIALVHRYSSAEDIETAGVIVAALSYGKVALFTAVARRLLEHMGRSPADFVRSFAKRKKGFPDISYRFAGSGDIQALLHALSVVTERHGSVRSVFTSGIGESDATIHNGITAAVREIRSVDLSAVYGRDIRPPGFLHLISGPEAGGAAKRMALYFRWMVRDRDIDFGVWKTVGPHRLVIPLDTHIARISRCLGLTRRLSSDWKTALDITEGLKRLDPADPLRYDFVLCHQGISGRCVGKRAPRFCVSCELR